MKGLCEVINHTYIMFDPLFEKIVSVKDQEISGVLGICVDKILCKIKKRKCRLIKGYAFGEKLENGYSI